MSKKKNSGIPDMKQVLESLIREGNLDALAGAKRTEPTAEQAVAVEDADLVDKGKARDLIAAKKRRDELDMEALNCYEQLPYQSEMHSSTAKTVLFNKGNQVGASLALYAELAMAVLNMDPFDKYPQKGRAAIAICGEKLIGEVAHKYLFEGGAFDVIRDRRTKKWRVYRPWSKDDRRGPRQLRGDLERRQFAKPAGPLIPPRFLDKSKAKSGIVYSKRSLKIFRKVYFTTGWELIVFNTEGPCEHGEGVILDLVCIDEDFGVEGWYAQFIARTARREGKIRWAAVPQNKVPDMGRVLRSADENPDNPDLHIIRVKTYDNPYLSDASIKNMEEAFMAQGYHVYERRMLGKMGQAELMVYSNWSSKTHGAIRPLSDEESVREGNGEKFRHPVQRILTESGGVIPSNWCVYLVTDPGVATAVTGFFAVPPPEIGKDILVMFDEVVVHHKDAQAWGKELAPRTKTLIIQDHLIDMHGGGITGIGSGIKAVTFYQRALEDNQIASVARPGSPFTFRRAPDDRVFKQGALRDKLNRHKDNENMPKFFVVLHRCPRFAREILEYKRKIERNGSEARILDEPNYRLDHDAIDTAEYASAADLKFVTRAAARQTKVDDEAAKWNRYADWGSSRSQMTFSFGARGV